MADLMQQQTKCPPKILTGDELRDLGTALKDALNSVAALQFRRLSATVISTRGILS